MLTTTRQLILFFRCVDPDRDQPDDRRRIAENIRREGRQDFRNDVAAMDTIDIIDTLNRTNWAHPLDY